ncbi:MAG: Lrp/AsnC family transcriptional regulator, partial [Thermoplasmata archaeon]
ISDQERELLGEVQRLPLTQRPFAEIGARLGMDEGDVLTMCRDLLERGVIRRLGPSISHRKVGFTGNPMTALRVPEEDVDEVGQIIAAEPDVTHCYARSGWDYNVFFMIHAKTREDGLDRAHAIVRKTGIRDFRVMFSTREFKKIPFEISKGSNTGKE